MTTRKKPSTKKPEFPPAKSEELPEDPPIKPFSEMNGKEREEFLRETHEALYPFYKESHDRIQTRARLLDWWAQTAAALQQLDSEAQVLSMELDGGDKSELSDLIDMQKVRDVIGDLHRLSCRILDCYPRVLPTLPLSVGERVLRGKTKG
jgi:hypothetical protein